MVSITSTDSTVITTSNQPLEPTRERNEEPPKTSSHNTSTNSVQPQHPSNHQSRMHSRESTIDHPPKRSMTVPSMGQLIRHFTHNSSFKVDSDYVDVPKDMDSAPNGSKPSPAISSPLWEYIKSFRRPEPKSKKTWETLDTDAFPQYIETTSSHPFNPDIEIKSKRRRYGRKVWKPIRAVLDTGCSVGNWVSADLIADLGITPSYNLSASEMMPAESFSGSTIEAKGAVKLTWRGIQDGKRGSQRTGVNKARNFTMRFLVTDVENSAFQMVIGADDIVKQKILSKPVLVLPRARRPVHNIVRNPKEVTPADVAIKHQVEKEENVKLKEKLKKEKEEEKKKKQAEELETKKKQVGEQETQNKQAGKEDTKKQEG